MYMNTLEAGVRIPKVCDAYPKYAYTYSKYAHASRILELYEKKSL